MDQIYYDYISDLNRQQYRISQIQRQLQNLPPRKTPLHNRSLLLLSDLLLNLGQRIRPAQFQVHVHDGTLEINTEGC
jgi:hypothetical protein